MTQMDFKDARHLSWHLHYGTARSVKWLQFNLKACFLTWLMLKIF